MGCQAQPVPCPPVLLEKGNGELPLITLLMCQTPQCAFTSACCPLGR